MNILVTKKTVFASLTLAALLAVVTARQRAAERTAKPQTKDAKSQAELEQQARRRTQAARRGGARSRGPEHVDVRRRRAAHACVRRVMGVPARDARHQSGTAMTTRSRTTASRSSSVSPGGAAERRRPQGGRRATRDNGKALKRDGGRVAARATAGGDARGEAGRQSLSALPARRQGEQGQRRRAAARGSLLHAGAAAVPAGYRTALICRTLPFMRGEGVFGSAELVPMTPKLGQYFGTDKGLLVVRAPDDSRLKLEEGDVIVDIDGRTPSSRVARIAHPRLLSARREAEAQCPAGEEAHDVRHHRARRTHVGEALGCSTARAS